MFLLHVIDNFINQLKLNRDSLLFFAVRREKDAYFKFLDKVDNYLLVTKFTIVTIQWVVLNLVCDLQQAKDMFQRVE